MNFRPRAARLITRLAFLMLLCSAIPVHAQVAADPSADGAATEIESPNLSANPDVSQGVSSGGGGGRSLLRQQAAGSRSVSSRALSSTSRLSQQKQAALYTATAAVPGAGTSTESAPRSLYRGNATPTINPLSFKPGVGRSLGMGLSSGFSTSTLLGSSQAGSLHPSSSASVSAPRSYRRDPSTASSASSLRGTPAHGAQEKSHLEGLSQKYTFQAPRSRYDKAAPESSFRGRHLSDQP